MSLDGLDPQVFLLALAALHIFGFMIAEARLSARNERGLRKRGAVEPAGDVWQAMRIAYPAAFAAMVIESALRGGPPPFWFLTGLPIWILAKLLKGWAISSLGDRWSFRVLVLPHAPLIADGPYRWLRHPNYVAVAGELGGAALMLAAPITGVAFTMAFIEILRRRVRVEERALGLRSAQRTF